MPFDMVQTIYALNTASNAACGHPDTPENLQELLNVYLLGGTYPASYGYYNAQNQFVQTTTGFIAQLNPSLAGGDWEVVWGPVVYTDLVENATTGNATNSAFVAYSPSNNAYVVAIAGTNFTSIEDWLSEDVDVSIKNRVQWADFNPIGLNNLTKQDQKLFVAMIDGGSALGVTTLLTKLIDTKQPAPTQLLGDFLLGLPSTAAFKTGATLYFTGHSLGGALTQVLSLYLYAQLTANNWDTILTLPTAGPTPGNEGFALLYDRIFPLGHQTGSSIVPNWNSDVISTADLVPACWNNLTNVFTLNTDAAGNYNSFFGELGLDSFSFTIPFFNWTITGVPFGEGMGKLAAALGTYFGIFYVPISQFKFTPTPGHFVRDKGTVTWTPFPLATDADPIEGLKALTPYVLYAHTYQYTYFFFGSIDPIPAFPGKPSKNN